MKTTDTDLIDVLVILLLSVIVVCGMLIAGAICREGCRMIVCACLGDRCNRSIRSDYVARHDTIVDASLM